MKILLIPLFFFFLFLSVSPAFASSKIIYAGSDGTWATQSPSVTGVVRNSTPTDNLNTYPWLQVGNFSTTQYISYVKFNLTSLSSMNISDAKFTINDASGGYAFQILAYNTTLNWNRTNVTWNNKPNNSAFQSSNTTYAMVPDPLHYYGPTQITFNVTNAVISAINSGINYVSIGLIANNTIYQSTFDRYGVTPILNITYTSNGGCVNDIIGSYCTSDATGIITTHSYSCDNNTLYVCPTGTRCTQITPQVNITTPLIENFTDCSKCSYVFTSNIWGLNPVLLWTNCPNYPECNPSSSATCLHGTNPVIVTCPGVFITPTDSVPASAYEYTAGCFDPALGWVPIVIDSQGNQTTINNLTITIFGNDTNLTAPVMNSCPNSTTSCYIVNNSVCVPVTCTPGTSYTGPNSITSLGAGLNADFGTPYATAVISFIVSGALGMFIFIKTSGKKLEAFIVPFFIAMAGFSMPGVEFFPIWIFLVMVVFSGVLIFWKAKGGG